MQASPFRTDLPAGIVARVDVLSGALSAHFAVATSIFKVQKSDI
jgi:hypothetical protein